MTQQKYPLAYLLPYLGRYRLKIALGFLMILLTVIAGLFSPWVLKFVIDDLQSNKMEPSYIFLLNWILKFVIDDLQAATALDKLPLYAALIIGISFLEGFFRFWMRKILIGMSRNIEYDLRNDFFSHVQLMSLSFLQSRSTGDIMSRATNDLSAVRFVLGPGIMYSMNTIILTVIGTTILLQLSWQLTLIAYIPLILVSGIVKYFGRRIHDHFETIQEQFSSLSTRTQENLAGIRVVKSFAREESELGTFEKLNREYVRRNIPLIHLSAMFYPLMTAIIGVSSVIVLWFGGWQVIHKHLTLGELVAFMGYLAMLTWPTIATGRVINIFQRGSASMRRILEIMNTPPQISSSPAATSPLNARGAIEFRDLTFRYPGTKNPVLRNINLTVPRGTTLAIVGHTGSGKSSLVNLIPRLFDPPSGTVKVDGKDVRDWPLSELRKCIGYVPQETFLFSETIQENIAFGSVAGMTDLELGWAAGISHISGDIETFSKKMQTYVGERGITLSGGQKQRIAISRAVAIRPRILIFDDSLSNVDTYTEERILEELSKIMKDRTTVLVSHRISTIKNADQIVVLKNGAVEEKGTHNSLMVKDGIYAALYRKQLLEEELKIT
jgi:ATP-binding cassette subfamily B multidrug efflux pump